MRAMPGARLPQPQPRGLGEGTRAAFGARSSPLPTPRAHSDAALARPPFENAVLRRLQNAVADSLGELDAGWHVLVDLRISGSGDVVGADYVIIHAQAGVALIDLMLARTDDAPERLRRLMDDSGFSAQFPGALPIVYLVLHTADTWLGDELEAAFADAAPLTVANPQWIYALRDLLVQTERASDPVISPIFNGSSAGVPAPSRSERRWEETRNWLDKLWHVIPQRRSPGSEAAGGSVAADVAGNAQPAGTSNEAVEAIGDQKRRLGDRPGRPPAWEPATGAGAFDRGWSASGVELASSLAATVGRSWLVCASVVLLAIFSSGIFWLVFGPTTSEETRRRIEVIGAGTSPPITAVVSVPDTAPEANPAEPRARVVDLGAQPPAPTATATASVAAPAADSQMKPEDTPTSPAAMKPVPKGREAVQRPAVSVMRGGEKNRHSLIFEWPSEVEFTVKVARGDAKILFRSAAQIDLHQLSSAASGLNPRVSRSNGNVLVLLKLPPNSRLTAHRRGNRVVLDIALPTALHR
jgi:hypothetical protein